MRAYNRIELEKVARETGFIRDNLEKVIRLSNILEFLVSDDSLKGKVVLKGGTAINLTVFDMPRLSSRLILTLIIATIQTRIQ